MTTEAINITDFIPTGKQQAITGKELAAALRCDTRKITVLIEKARRDGAPICAACSGLTGYYMAETAEELEGYCNSLYHRGSEIMATRRALLQVLRKIQQKELQSK